MPTLRFNSSYDGFTFEGTSRYVDEHGKAVSRTPITNPYGYDMYVQERVGANEESNHVIYSDRLLDWDYKKTRQLMLKHFKDTGIDVGGDYYSARSAKAIEGFLREWYDNPILRVILVMQGCNVSTGYPVWAFFLDTGSKSKKPKSPPRILRLSTAERRQRRVARRNRRRRLYSHVD